MSILVISNIICNTLDDVHYMSSDEYNLVITVSLDLMEFMHVIIDLCAIRSRDIKSYIQRNSIFKRCSCQICNIIYTNYVIEHPCDGTNYILQICANCVEHLAVGITYSNFNRIVALANCMNIYNANTNEVKYVVINQVEQQLINNRPCETTNLCKICKYTLTMHDVCKICFKSINCNFHRCGSIKYMLLTIKTLPELSNLIGMLFIEASRVVYD